MEQPRFETQIVPFRLLECPDCHHMMCSVNPKMPNYCLECGKFIYKRTIVHMEDKEARLRTKGF